MTASELVSTYLDQNYRCVFWPQIGDAKGPHEEGWTRRVYTLADYHDGYRVGLITGHELSPGRYLHDVDLDWTAGSEIAQQLLPPTGFVYGRTSKRTSHCFYTCPEPLATIRYEDIDKTCLIELRGTKTNGDVGMQTMVPPSVWSKDGVREPLTFLKSEGPTHLSSSSLFKQQVCLSAIGMICARHLGVNGFGHEARLAWAGFLLKMGFTVDQLIPLGEAMSGYTNNREIADVRRVVESTAIRMRDPSQKIASESSFAKCLGDAGRAVVTRIRAWLGRDEDFIRTGTGVIVKDHQANIKRALFLLDHDFSFNEFSDTMLIDGVPLEDQQMSDLWLKIDEQYGFRSNYMFFEKVIQQQARQHPFHPVRQYLDALRWDGEKRLETWLIKNGKAVDNPYVRAISKIVLIAAVRRVRHPGCKFDELLVLESPQGYNKSSALRALCPFDAWFSDDLNLNFNSQKLIEATLGKWIIESAELSGKRRTELEQLKAMLSRQIDGPARMAYARLPIERPRQFILIGTTNNLYLPDPTGSRRFWPVTVQNLDVPRIKDHRDQLWAEAAYLEAQGVSIRLDDSLWRAAGKEQDQRREIDPWEDIIRHTILNVLPGTDEKRRITTDELWQALDVKVERRDGRGAQRIAEIVRRLGCRAITVRKKDEKPKGGYVTDNPLLFEDNEEGEEP